MSLSLQMVLAQLNLKVGALEENTRQILATLAEHPDADLVVFPELALTGYPPEDLLFRLDLYQHTERCLGRIAAAVPAGQLALVGHPETDGDQVFNCLSVLSDGQCLARYRKQELPNYGVFDEPRYFTPGAEPVVVECRGQRIGLLICEDLWVEHHVLAARNAGAELLVSVNASPFEEYKYEQRLQVLQRRACESGLPLVYLNLVGGQDELVFDGNSVVLNGAGEVLAHLPHCEVAVEPVQFVAGACVKAPEEKPPAAPEAMYQALQLALRDYVKKNGFPGVLLGLSGGIDSALTLALAIDALGADQVQAVMMPYHYTAQMSISDAQAQAEQAGCRFDIVPVAPMVEAHLTALKPIFGEAPADTTEENLQARCRGTLLMAISNKQGKLLLATGNKSELAVGYCTLYGDMNGGFAPLKDLPKTQVYELARFRNSLSPAIPERVIERPPSAELAPDQKDEDSLPPYPVLDEIIEAYATRNLSVADLVLNGYPATDVRRVVSLIERNEYKRRQGAVGPKVTRRNFGKDRRFPITHGYLHMLLTDAAE